MSEREDRLGALIAGHNPVPGDAAGALLTAHAREAILARLRCGRAPRWRRFGFPALAASLALAGCLLAVVVLRDGAGGPPGSVLAMVERNYRTMSASSRGGLRAAAFAPAGERLLRLAEAAERQPPWTREPGLPYSHLVIEEWSTEATIGAAAADAVIVPRIVEMWMPVSGTGVYRRDERPGEPHLEGFAGVRPVWPASPAPARDRVQPVRASMGPWAARLSRTPATLRDQLAEGQDPGRPPTARLLQAVLDLHAREAVEPGLAAALWRVLAERPDLYDLGAVADRLGRAGRAIGFDDGPPRMRIIVISPETGRLIAAEDISLSTPKGPATVGYQTFISQEWAAAW
ncbi:hypothetical protein [Nonomuraea sp. NPDC046570]|uniref:hypothetical protein n=1 Tax=Nonomuraea sp. NPDC046570 TaxID=3155255 RepID=UPI0033F4047E